MSYTLSEHESKRLLADAGLPVPEERLAADAAAAARAADALGYPVALKLCGRGIAHKTERGLVRLGLADPEAVRREAEDLLGLRRAGEESAQVLVGRMAGGSRELIAGLVRDPQFGPCVMLGLGGIFAEALGDVAFALAPLDPPDAEDLIGALQHAHLLDAFRGEPPVDRAALARLLVALGEVAAARPEIRSIDLNPLRIVDARPVVLDALVELEDGA
ncbi:MAG: acetate--CoA ligase family protein [Proteobacteria bacterium]|nr:acetate--CoA ligase family protein [Pseudomonadota bacterium]